MGNREIALLVIVGILILGALGLSQEAFALPVTSAQTGNWQDDSTWVGGVAPSGTDDVSIKITPSYSFFIIISSST